MEQSIKISVIVPIYNAEKYLDKCIQSIVNQTYRNLEIILVNDGSQGREEEICRKYEKIDSRIKYICKENGGAVSARIRGIEEASGEYIGFVDADDYILPAYYELIYEKIAKYGVDMVATGYREIRSEDEVLWENGLCEGLYLQNQMSRIWERMNCFSYYKMGLNPALWNKVFKADLLKEYGVLAPLELRMGDDAAMTFPSILHCTSAYIDNDNKGYGYRQVDNSLSRTWNRNYFKHITALYNYLKPYYGASSNPIIIEQLELYRVFLIEIGLVHYVRKLSFLERIHLFKNISTCIRNQLDNEFSIFNNISVETLDLASSGVRNDIILLVRGRGILLASKYQLRNLID